MGQTPKALPHGHSAEHTYVDERFGMSYPIPDYLEPQTTLVNGVVIGDGVRHGDTEFLFSALDKPVGGVRSGLIIVANYPDKSHPMNVGQFMEQKLKTEFGPQATPNIRIFTVLGRPFAASDLTIKSPVSIFITNLTTECNGMFLTFTLSANTPEKLAQILKSVDAIKLNCKAEKP
jgi:hypothetical protein